MNEGTGRKRAKYIALPGWLGLVNKCGKGVLKITGDEKDTSTRQRLFSDLEPGDETYSALFLKLSACALRAAPADHQLVIEMLLDTAGKFVRADRLYLFLYDFEKDTACIVYQWPAESSSFKKQPRTIPLSELTPVLNYHLKGEAVYLPWTFKPGKSTVDSYLFNGSKKCSAVLVPLVFQEQCLGFVGLEKTGVENGFLSKDVELLSAVSELIAGIKVRSKRDREALKLNKKYVELVENTSDWIWETSAEGIFTFSNLQAEKLTGYSRAELIGESAFSFMRPEEAERVRNIVTAAVTGRYGLQQVQNEFIHKNGRPVYFETSGEAVFDAKGNVAGFRGISRDVSEKVKSNRQLAYMSMHDRLTGLYNRNYFEEEIRRLAKSRDYPITVIYADVNGLKAVNDAFGHEKGDELLKEAARALKTSLRSCEVLARIGGDEFAAVLLNTDKETARKVARRIRKKVALYNKKRKAVPLSLAVGMATAVESGQSLEELLNKADDLMYKDKILHRMNASHTYSNLPASIMAGEFFGSEEASRLLDLCLGLANALRLNPPAISKLEKLVSFHNLGKAGIPEKILYKKGSLNQEEQKVIRLHPEKGYRIAMTSADLSEIAELILKHHEWWDGRGYPLGLKGKEIPVECRILAVADAFVAMTAGRSYRKPLSYHEALEELKSWAGFQFDPQVVEVFCKLQGEIGNLEA